VLSVAVLVFSYNEDAPISYNGGPGGSKPFRCPDCKRIGVTAIPRPRCFGRPGDTHPPVSMKRVPERLRSQAVKLIIK
jgi:hypothetical protein